MVLLESDPRILGKTVRIGMEGLEKTFNLSADSRVLRTPPVSRYERHGFGTLFSQHSALHISACIS